MIITFLGTSSMVPTKKRNQTSVVIQHNAETILVDCGEGTQRQFSFAGISLQKVTKILITHWHGDHVLGLPGIIQTLNASSYSKTLEIYGPKGTKKFLKHMFSAFAYSKKIDIKIKEVAKGTFLKTKDLEISCAPLFHSTPSLGFRIKEKPKRNILESKVIRLGVPKGPLWGKLQSGRDITFKGKKIPYKKVSKEGSGRIVTIFGDTKECQNAVTLAKGADVLICESTFEEKEVEKAKEYNHLTSVQAANIAKKAKVKKLYLTHFSTRYNRTKKLIEEAKKIFPNVKAASDFLKVKVK